MADFPALPLFTDAFLADTGHLDATETGAYLSLLMAAWRSPGCRLPDDPVRLARMARCDQRTWKRVSATVLSFWTRDDDGMLKQKRLSKTFEFCNTSRQKKREAAEATNRKLAEAKSLETPNRTNAERDAERNAERPLSGTHSNPIQSNLKESSPKPPSTPPPAATRDDGTTPGPVKDQFDKLDAALRAIPGISDHPVAIDPVIAPIYQLAQRGLDLKTQIVPSITRQVQTSKRPIRRWSFFVPGIEADANPVGSVTPQAAKHVDDEKWQRLLDIGRRKQQWDLKNYGPAPGQPGCRVPAKLIQPGDGDGWTEWRAAS
jgi:uncharacterized protein YdaU (DUF1376 family)